MSTSWPPPPTPPGAASPAPAGKPRPNAWWFALGGGLMLAAVVVTVLVLIGLFASITKNVAALPADGRPHDVQVSTSHDLLLYADLDSGEPSCVVVDRATGADLRVRDMGSTSISRGDSDAFGRFDPGSGNLTLTCRLPVNRTVTLGPMPHPPAWTGGLAGAILIPGGLALAGLVSLVVTGSLFVVRRRR